VRIVAFAALALSAWLSATPVCAAGVPIVVQRDAASALTGVEYFVRAGLDRQSVSENGLAALTAESLLHMPVTFDRPGGGTATVPLADAIAASGGSIAYTMDGHDVRFYIEGVAGSEDALLQLFAGVLAKPSFSPDVVRDARNALQRKLDENQQIALQVALEMLDRSFYPGSSGMPPYGDAASLAQLTSHDAASFFARYYRRGGSVVSAVGAVDQLSSGTLDRLASAVSAGSTAPSRNYGQKLRGSSQQLVAHRDVNAPWLVAQYPAPPLGSRDFGAMLVLVAFIDRTLADVAEVPSVISRSLEDQATGTIYRYDAQPANLIVYLDGGLGDPTKTFATTLTVINLLGATRLQGSIEDFKATARGDFAFDSTSLENRAWIAGVFAMQGAPPQYMSRTLDAIARVSPTDLQRVARKYLGNPTIALILPRDTSVPNT
jgi:predicted Zn-dependent peptidase